MMMSNESYNRQPLLLVRNTSYTLYQLYALAGENKASPETTLKVVILETVEWLRQRFRDFELPKELDLLASKDAAAFDFANLKSFQLDMGYKLEVIWLPEQRIWTLQLTEPDLGPEPGKDAQRRAPVPGRLFETDIAYKLSANGVECGFKTIVHEPVGTTAECEVFRLAFIKRIARNPSVGLFQGFPLIDEPHILSDGDAMRRFRRYVDSELRTMPIIIVCEHVEDHEIDPQKRIPTLDEILPPPAYRTPAKLLSPVSTAKINEAATTPRLPLDIASIARYKMGYAQFFILPYSQRDNFQRISAMEIENGSILTIEPASQSGREMSYHYEEIAHTPEMATVIDNYAQNYTRKKAFSFGGCVFAQQAQSMVRESIIKLHDSKMEMADSYLQQLAAAEKTTHRLLVDAHEESVVANRNARIAEKECERLKEENKNCMDEAEKKYSSLEKQLAKKNAQIEYLLSKDSRPQRSSEFADWVSTRFSGRLIFHERATSMMQKVSPEKVNTALLCDALEYLATEYRNELLGLISQEECDRLCAEKYGRGFTVTPIKGTSIEMYPANYKIKYYIGYKGRTVESILNLHLKIGNDPSNLLRIYFLYDKEKRLIVVGSLPEHLKTVSY